jgi:spore coat polysaccharide biosynthesis protein SpsF (cytidylyltransferase family)
MRTVAVIQARSGSTRFPGKVTADLCGRPMLAHVIERVTRAVTVDRVVVATTDLPADDAVADLAARCGAAVTRGPVDDVLGRFVVAAREHGAGVVVRVTADCPLVDPSIIDAVVRARAEQAADYASNLTPPTYPDGYDAEAVTTACLERLAREVICDYEREHVTARVRERPELFSVVNVAGDRDLSGIRLTVDVPEDLVRVASILAALDGDPLPGLSAVVAAIEADPTLSDQSKLPGRDERYHRQRDRARHQGVAGW